jgi:hypothetical protein
MSPNSGEANTLCPPPYRYHELRDEAVHGLVEELRRRADLLDHAVVHHRDAVADGHRLFLVVGHEDRRDAQALVQALQLAAHLHAQLRVEVREGLVEEQHLGFDGERSRQRDALLLASGELARTPLLVARQSHELERGLGTPPHLGAGKLALLEPEGDVAHHAHVRPQRVVLEHHADVALPGGNAGDVPSADEQLARLVLVEARDEAQQRRLAGARRPEEGEELPGLDGQRDVPQDRGGPVRKVDVPRFDAYLLHALLRSVRRYDA